METEQNSQEAGAQGFVLRPRQGKESKADVAAPPEVSIASEGPRRSPQRAEPHHRQQRGPDGGPSSGSPEHSAPKAVSGCLLPRCVSTDGLTHTRALVTGRGSVHRGRPGAESGGRIQDRGGRWSVQATIPVQSPCWPQLLCGAPHPSRPRGSVSSGTSAPPNMACTPLHSWPHLSHMQT